MTSFQLFPTSMGALKKRIVPQRFKRSSRQRFDCNFLPQIKCNLFSQIQSAGVIISVMAPSPHSRKKVNESERHAKCPCATDQTCCKLWPECSSGQNSAKHIYESSDSADKCLRWKGVSEKDTGHANPLEKDDYVRLRVARIEADGKIKAAAILALGALVVALLPYTLSG